MRGRGRARPGDVRDARDADRTRRPQRLADAGLDYYNHNLDTSPEFYGEIITTRTYDDRLETLANVRDAGVKVCCGGIVGMGETRRDRAGLLAQLASLDPHPESVPINLLVQVPGTPLFGTAELDPLELVRTIAAARIMMPASVVRLSAGRIADDRRAAGAVPARRRQQHLPRRPAAHHAEPRRRPRPRPARPPRHATSPSPISAVARSGASTVATVSTIAAVIGATSSSVATYGGIV